MAASMPSTVPQSARTPHQAVGWCRVETGNSALLLALLKALHANQLDCSFRKTAQACTVFASIKATV